MGKFDNRNSFRNQRHDRRQSERAPMHEATCANCGKSCLVPFVPTGNRPIFCKDCFKSNDNANPARRSNDRDRSRENDRPLFDAICAKCGNRCRIPFQPRPGKEVFCSHCFDQLGKDGKEDLENTRIQEQLDAINIKLGKILQMLNTKTPEVVTPVEQKAETILPAEPEAQKPVKKKVTRKKATTATE